MSAMGLAKEGSVRILCLGRSALFRRHLVPRYAGREGGRQRLRGERVLTVGPPNLRACAMRSKMAAATVVSANAVTRRAGDSPVIGRFYSERAPRPQRLLTGGERADDG